MTKKSTTHKPAKRTASSQHRRRAKTHKAADDQRQPEKMPQNQLEHTAPKDHYYGETHKAPAAGSLEEETLSADAPYNRTYGRERSAGR